MSAAALTLQRDPSPRVSFEPSAALSARVAQLSALLPHARREASLARFEASSLGKTEAWWYTPLGKRLAPRYTLDEAPLPTPHVEAREGAVCVLTFEEASALLSDPSSEGSEGSLAHRAARAAQAQLAQIAREEDDRQKGEPYAALNSAHTSRGFVIFAPKSTSTEAGTSVEVGTSAEVSTTSKTPARVSFTWPRFEVREGEQSEAPTAQLTRLLVICEEGAQLEVIERVCAAQEAREGEPLSVHTTELSLAEGSALSYVRLQALSLNALHVGRVSARLAARATLNATSLNLGAALSRVELEVDLEGEGAEAHLAGAFTGSGAQHLDQHLTLRHLAPRCFSSQRFKGLLGAHSRGVFTGRVLVAEGASGTRAEQSNPNLVLSEGARAVTRPQLEIYNDDVECSHGATVGQLDEEALFYLRSRGLTPEMSERMLAEAFVGELLQGLSDEVSVEEARAALARTLS